MQKDDHTFDQVIRTISETMGMVYKSLLPEVHKLICLYFTTTPTSEKEFSVLITDFSCTCKMTSMPRWIAKDLANDREKNFGSFQLLCFME